MEYPLVLMSLLTEIICLIFSSTATEFCVSESFMATCSPGQVIVMTSAFFGRMKHGRCIKQNFGYLGCKADVLSVLDRKCSGRQSCRFQVPTPELEALHTCPEDLKSYLEADYQCLSVIRPARRLCGSQTFARIASTHGYLASSQTADTSCGSPTSPWLIEAPKGKHINLTLHDFSWSPAHSQLVMESDLHKCYKFAVIKDVITSIDVTLCDNQEREVHIMTSNSNQVEIQMLTGEKDETQRHFLIEYKVFGCEDLPAPENGQGKRTDDVMVFSCHGSDLEWQLECRGDEWHGPNLNCSAGGKSNRGSSSNSVQAALGLSLISHELSIIVIILTAVFITTIILVVGFLCVKRHSEPPLVMEPEYSPYAMSMTPRSTRGSFKLNKDMTMGPRPAMYMRGMSRDSNDYAVIGEIIGPNMVAHGDCCHDDDLITDSADAGCSKPEHSSFKYDIPQYYELDQGVPGNPRQGSSVVPKVDPC